MSQSASMNVDQLFQAAVTDGALSKKTAVKVANFGTAIQANLGIRPDAVKASEVVLVNALVDDSGSIESEGNPQAVRDGVNGILDALALAKKKDDVLVLIQFLNRGTLQPYTLLSGAERLTGKNYRPNGGTPLFRKSIEFLGTVIAKTQEFALSGVACRSVSLIATDGADNESSGTPASEVAAVVRDMLRMEQHIIFGYGIADGMTDFKRVFRDMGIKDNAILESANDPKAIRQAFQLFSQSAVRASQNTQSFSKVAAGGFSN